MKKFRISDKQYLNIINEFINESIYLKEGEKYVSDKYITDFQKSINNAIQDKLKTDTNLQQKADEIGINQNYSKKGKMNMMNQYLEPETANISSSMTDKVKAVVNILRGVTNSTGGINQTILKKNADNGAEGYYGLSYADILRVKDFIDSLDLRFLYDSSVNPASKVTFKQNEVSKLYKFGIIINRDGTYDDSKFDLNDINKDQFNTWYTDSRQENISQAKAFIEMKEQIVDKYLQSVYGMQFTTPNFALGNQKVTDALMINFTSAFRCPAWNECLVKHACYARAGEGRHYNNVKPSNDRKNLMWEACEDDPKLTKMVYDLLKAYVVDWDKVVKTLKTANIGKVGSISKISQMYFRDMPEGLLDVIKECKRVSYIRLNENGDFINQNLLESFDKLAEDFKFIDVNTAAYSCRNLNFKGIKNIIINASRMEMEGPTIARYFYAIPVKMYEAFEDTYTSKSMTNSFDSIGKTPLPLFSVDANGNKTPNGSFYYKCPCSREDFSLINTKNGKVKENQAVNCYQCHLCYEPNDESIKSRLQNGGKYFVFVKAHGSHANVLDEKREMEIIRKVGVPENYQVGLRDTGEGYDDNLVVHEGKSLITENRLADEAYNEITKNAIYSMTQHFGNLRSGMVEGNENFFSASVDKILNEKKLRTES
jgi:hypothetical protein